jgi:AraC family transcriptional regulator
LGPVYAAVIEYLMKNGYEIAGAPMELYLNNPMDVPESGLLTEVQVPVMKR